MVYSTGRRRSNIIFFSKCLDRCGAEEHYFIIVREMPFKGLLEGFFSLNKDVCFLKEEPDLSQDLQSI